MEYPRDRVVMAVGEEAEAPCSGQHRTNARTGSSTGWVELARIADLGQGAAS
jgi:hypothetical protein